MRIWCPWDTEHSEYVKVLGEWFDVVYSDKDMTGQDFMTWQPKKWDVIISNPPFQHKKQTFERALSFGKPFCILMTLNWLADSAPKQLFMEKDLQLLMFDKRIHFANLHGVVQKKTTFSSAYFCHDFLPKQIIMRKLVDPNAKTKKK